MGLELIIIASVLGYLFVSPDKRSLAFSRGVTGAARGAITGKSPKNRKTKKRKTSPRRRAMLDGWREGITTARERREAGKDLWSRGTRASGRVYGGGASLVRGIKSTVDARRARHADQDTETTDSAPTDDIASAVVDQDGNTVTVQNDQNDQPVEPSEPNDLAGTKLCAECKEVPVTDGEICGACQYRQKLRNQHHDEQGKPNGPAETPDREIRKDVDWHSTDKYDPNAINPPTPQTDDDAVAGEPSAAPNRDDINLPPAASKPCGGCGGDLAPITGVTIDGVTGQSVVDLGCQGDCKQQYRLKWFPKPTTSGPVIGSDFHQSTTTPNGATPMSIAKTELNHIEDLAKEVKTVETAVAGVAEAWEILRKWGVDLPERYAAAGWGTAGLDAAVTTAAEMMSQFKFPAVTEAMGNIQAKITEARGVGEIVNAHQARGNAEAFAGR